MSASTILYAGLGYWGLSYILLVKTALDSMGPTEEALTHAFRGDPEALMHIPGHQRLLLAITLIIGMFTSPFTMAMSVINGRILGSKAAVRRISERSCRVYFNFLENIRG